MRKPRAALSAGRRSPTRRSGPREVLVEVHATAVNRADLLQRAGGYPPPPGAPETLGLELAGVVAETGGEVSRARPGDRVCALLAGGGTPSGRRWTSGC